MTDLTTRRRPFQNGYGMATRLLGLLIALTMGTATSASASAADASSKRDAVDFVRDVQPILVASCVDCHQATKAKGGLRLDSRGAAMKGGVSGAAIVPGKSAESLLMVRVRGEGDEPRMPEKKPALTPLQLDVIAKWIDQGAIWPDAAAGDAVATARHWSFVKPARPAEPATHTAGWARNPVDRFVLARLESAGLKPSPEADRATLLRRVSLDLTGLPPTPEEVDAFLADASPDAYERAVDRLLASLHYGERWAKHWLDAARYADSNGYSIDAPREIWLWRDWVIDAINRDLPFDQFTREQIAGDLLPNARDAQRIATGFHRNTQINQEGGIDPEQFRVEAVVDRVGTTGTVWLGLSVACAQCHNHKFDPISQKEYYRLMAFLNTQDESTLKVADPADKQAYEHRVAEAEAEYKRFEAEARSQPDQGKSAEVELGIRKRELAELKKRGFGKSTLVLTERPTPRETFVFIKGDFTRRGETVTAGTPAVLHPLQARPTTPLSRIDLANWLVDTENPLTARVQVNRMWMRLFGRGIVETENDFGTQGTPPTHPELLDWLAVEFMEGAAAASSPAGAKPAATGRTPWSQKAMLRLLVTSAAYRQSSVVRPDLAEVDPYNKLFGRQNRTRLDAEIVRDVALSASGLLSRKIGGPSVFPPQPEGVASLGQVRREWKVSTGPDRYRRGMYTFLFRATPHPLLAGFDAPDGTSTCTRRLRSNTPLQALTLLNDTAFVEMAQALAARVLASPGDDSARAAFAFRLATGRVPDADEVQILLGSLKKQREALAGSAKQATGIAGTHRPAGVPEPEFAAWTILARAVLNTDEAITRE
jgi:cytochrome c553